MTKEIPYFLNQIVRNIEHEKELKRFEQEINLRYLQTAKILSEETRGLLERKGVIETISVGTGKGGGAIGYRLETTSRLKTEPLNLQYKDKDVQLQISENVTGGSEYSINHDSISILVKIGDDDQKEMFRIKNVSSISAHKIDKAVTNSKGEKATEQELEIALRLIEYLNKELKTPEPSKTPTSGVLKTRFIDAQKGNVDRKS